MEPPKCPVCGSKDLAENSDLIKAESGDWGIEQWILETESPHFRADRSPREGIPAGYLKVPKIRQRMRKFTLTRGWEKCQKKEI